MKHLFEFRKKSAEQVSQRIFYILIALAVLVFGLFFLVGYDMPFEENPDFTAPLFTDVLIGLMWLFLVGGIGLAIYPCGRITVALALRRWSMECLCAASSASPG